MSDDREHQYDRRREDRLLIELDSTVRSLKTDLAEVEGMLRANTGEIGRIRTTLGDRLTTLMFELDQRYMPRTELRREYVPRAEHEENERARKTWHRQWPTILIAALVLIVQAITLAHALHY